MTLGTGPGRSVLGTRPSLVAIPALLVAVCSSQVHAQGVDVRFIAANFHHELIGDVVGPSFHVAFPVAGQRTAVLLGVSRLTGASSRIGVPCGGLIDPSACHPELLRDQGSVSTVEIGVTTLVREPGRIGIRVRGDLGAGRVISRTSALASGRRLNAARTMWQAAASSEFYWRPFQAKPFSLVAAGTFGHMGVFGRSGVEDGYTPFEQGFGLSRVSLGAVWGWGQ